jgi:hypothetical protein
MCLPFHLLLFMKKKVVEYNYVVLWIDYSADNMVCLPISTESKGCLPMTKNTFTLKREVVNERIFDAPRVLVWKVSTDPELVPKWWGLKYLTTTVDKMERRST